MAIRTVVRSFTGGEITSEFFGRLDDVKNQNGLAVCRNFLIYPHGVAANRGGTEFVREVKYSDKGTRILRFNYGYVAGVPQSFVIELGHQYMRFHTRGATLLTGTVPAWDSGTTYIKSDLVEHSGVKYYAVDESTNQSPPNATYWYPLTDDVYEIPTPYDEEDLFDVHYVQSADVVTLVHPKYAPKELRRYGATNWQLTDINFESTLSAPTGVSAVTAGNSTVKYTYSYVVTAVESDNVTESEKSSAASVGSNLFETGATVTISWTAVAGAARYRVYKLSGGIYGYIGSTEDTSLVDDNITADTSVTPPIYDTDIFTASGSITAVAVTSGGSGYQDVSTSGGGITSVVLNQDWGNFGIRNNPELLVSDASGSGATFDIPTPYPPLYVTVTNAGSGYTSPKFSLVADPSATYVSAFDSSKVRYTLSPVVAHGPSIVISDATGSGAELKAIVSGGVITGVEVVKGGLGYTNPTFSVVSSDGGSGAVLGAATISDTGDNPAATTYFEQRRVFCGTPVKPQNIWMTKSGTETNMSYSYPIKDDDRILFRVAAREASSILHAVPLGSLLLLTSSAEWAVTSLNTDALTPSSISVRPQSYVGSNNVQPIIVNNNLIFAAARGGHLRELAYDNNVNSYVTGDLSLRAPHLFDGLEILDLAYQKAPCPTVWAVSSNGDLIGLTYVPEQQVGAFHRHDTYTTQGKSFFESVIVVEEDEDDMVYTVVNRAINGQQVRFIERLSARRISSQEDGFFVDSGLSYNGDPVQTIGGLDHLVGETVSVMADGAEHPQCVVDENGEITLQYAASRIVVGLPVTADLQTPPVGIPAAATEASGQGRPKNINRVWVRVHKSFGFKAGPSFEQEDLMETKVRTDEVYGTPPYLQSGELELPLVGDWEAEGQVCIRNDKPLPLTVCTITQELAIGG